MMGLLADWWAEEVEVTHRQALERPYRIEARRARRTTRRLARAQVEAAADQARAEREALAALEQLRLEEARLAAARATAIRDAAWARIEVVRAELAGRAQIEG